MAPNPGTHLDFVASATQPLVVIVIRVAYPYGNGQFLEDAYRKASNGLQWLLERLGLAKPPVYPT